MTKARTPPNGARTARAPQVSDPPPLTRDEITHVTRSVVGYMAHAGNEPDEALLDLLTLAHFIAYHPDEAEGVFCDITQEAAPLLPGFDALITEKVNANARAWRRALVRRREGGGRA